ncbi:MAG: hypothetical protein AAF985_10830 [Bacteroidota bacterium]
MNRLAFLILLLFSATSCQGQEQGKPLHGEAQQLLKREKQHADRAKSSQQSSRIKVISDLEEVERLRKYISEQKKAQQSRQRAELQNKTIAQRYKAGDQSLVPQLIQMLQGKDPKARAKVYRDLERSYDDPKNYQITERPLIQAILNNISLPEDETAVVQLAGFMDLPGYPKVFEKHLLSGQAQKTDRLIFWLGEDGKSEKALAHVKTLLENKDFNFDKHYNVLSGLEGFFKNGTPAIRRQAFDIALEIYNQKRIPQEKFIQMKSSWSSDNVAINIAEILFGSSDSRVLPLAHDFLEMEVWEEKALTSLVKLEGKKHQALVFQFLRDQEKLADGLQPAAALYQIDQDQEIVKTMLVEFEKRSIELSYMVERIASTLIDMGATESFANLDQILKNKALIKSLQDQYALSQISLESLAQDLYDFEIIDQMFSKERLEKAKLEMEQEEYDQGIDNFLISLGVLLWFDAETGFLPVDYDELIMAFTKISQGKLNDLDVWMDAVVDEEHQVQYNIQVDVNEKIYLMTPEDIGDWYDVGLTFQLMNRILDDAGLEEEFVFIDTGDQTVKIIFGDQAKVSRFAKKYRL